MGGIYGAGGGSTVMGVIGFLLCGIVGGLDFSLKVTCRVGGVANFEAKLRFACSGSDGVLCV